MRFIAQNRSLVQGRGLWIMSIKNALDQEDGSDDASSMPGLTGQEEDVD